MDDKNLSNLINSLSPDDIQSLQSVAQSLFGGQNQGGQQAEDMDFFLFHGTPPVQAGCMIAHFAGKRKDAPSGGNGRRVPIGEKRGESRENSNL